MSSTLLSCPALSSQILLNYHPMSSTTPTLDLAGLRLANAVLKSENSRLQAGGAEVEVSLPARSDAIHELRLGLTQLKAGYTAEKSTPRLERSLSLLGGWGVRLPSLTNVTMEDMQTGGPLRQEFLQAAWGHFARAIESLEQGAGIEGVRIISTEVAHGDLLQVTWFDEYGDRDRSSEATYMVSGSGMPVAAVASYIVNERTGERRSGGLPHPGDHPLMAVEGDLTSGFKPCADVRPARVNFLPHRNRDRNTAREARFIGSIGLSGLRALEF